MTTEKEKLQVLNNALSIQILFESMLHNYTEDAYEIMKSINPTLASLCRKDIETLHRNHRFYFKKFENLVNKQLLVNFEELTDIVEKYLIDKLAETNDSDNQ